MKYCPFCGAPLGDNAAFCTSCGNKAGTNTGAPYPHEERAYPQPESYPPPRPPRSRKNGLGIAGFVLSLVGIIPSAIVGMGLAALSTSTAAGTGTTLTAYILLLPGLLFSVAGLIFGIAAKRQKGLAIAGIIISVVIVGVFALITKALIGG